MVDSALDTLPCLPAALPVADLLATVYRPLQPLPPRPEAHHQRAIQDSLGQLAQVITDLWAPQSGWPAHLPRTATALLPYLGDELAAVQEARAARATPPTAPPTAPAAGTLDTWATWVLGQLVTCGPDVMALLEGETVRLVPVVTLTLPQVYTLDLVTRTPWHPAAALAPETPIALPFPWATEPLSPAIVLERLWQRLRDHCPALVSLAQGWPVTLLPPGRGEGNGTLTLTLFLGEGKGPGDSAPTEAMPPPHSEWAGEALPALAQGALGILAWAQGAIAPWDPRQPSREADLALVTALMGLAPPWENRVSWEQLWPWLRWWVVQADGELLSWLAGVPGRWLVPGQSWTQGHLGLAVCLCFAPPETHWQVDILTGTWQGEGGLSDSTRLQGLPGMESGRVTTVAQVRSHLEGHLRHGAPALAPLWTGIKVQWGLPQEPTTTLTGTLTLHLRLNAIPG